MANAIAGTAAQANQSYLRAEQQSRAEVRQGVARVERRSFGFRLGSFGLSYRTENVRIEPPAPPARATFSDALETAALRREAVTSAASETLNNLPPQRRAGLRAYQDNLSAAQAPHRTLLAVA